MEVDTQLHALVLLANGRDVSEVSTDDNFPLTH